jgi:hypothetical protein
MTGGWGTPTSAAAERVELGETFVSGKDQPTAAALLQACRDLDYPTLVVRTVTGGFVVPDPVYDRYANDLAEPLGI